MSTTHFNGNGSQVKSTDPKTISIEKHRQIITRIQAESNWFKFRRDLVTSGVFTRMEALFYQDLLNLSNIPGRKKDGEDFSLFTSSYLESSLDWGAEAQKKMLATLKERGFVTVKHVGPEKRRWIRVESHLVEEAILDKLEQEKPDEEVEEKVQETPRYKSTGKGCSVQSYRTFGPKLPNTVQGNLANNGTKPSKTTLTKTDKIRRGEAAPPGPPVFHHLLNGSPSECYAWNDRLLAGLRDKRPIIPVRAGNRSKGAAHFFDLWKRLNNDSIRVEAAVSGFIKNINKIDRPSIESVKQFCVNFTWIEDALKKINKPITGRWKQTDTGRRVWDEEYKGV